MYALLVIPSSTVLLASTGEYSSGLFTDLLPIVFLGAGLLVGGLLVWFIGDRIVGAVIWLLHGRRDRFDGM